MFVEMFNRKAGSRLFSLVQHRVRASLILGKNAGNRVFREEIVHIDKHRNAAGVVMRTATVLAL
jgi:hypothetical protein